MKSTTGFDDQFTIHPDDVAEGSVDNLSSGKYYVEHVDNTPVISDLGEFKEDPFTSDFPFEIKAIFWVMVVIVVGMLFGVFW